MKELMAYVLVCYLFVAFVCVGFGVWPTITLIIGVVVGFIYTLLT